MQNAFAVMSDIHSNYEALTAVLDDMKCQEIAQIVCLGDTVGYASGVKSCLRAVRGLGCPVLMGNHDEAACLPELPEDLNETAAAGIRFSSARLSETDRSWLQALPRTLKTEGITFTHASLEDETDWPYILFPEDAHFHFAQQSTPLAFCGHTHEPMVWWQESPRSPCLQQAGVDVISLPSKGKLLVNVGSVGQPRDGDTRSCYVICRPEQNTVEFRRLEYDIKRTKRKILRAKLPRFTAQRLSLGE
jgi:predicted phosphodiesterase